MPVAGYRPTGGHPAVIANCFSLRTGAGESKTDRKEKVKSCCFPGKVHPGAVAKVAHAHHNNNRNVFDEWVCGFQGANPFIHKRQTGERKSPFTCLLTYRLNCNPTLKKYFLMFFSAAATDFIIAGCLQPSI